MNNKVLIYQIFTRIYGNRNTTRKKWGTVAENGSGKFNDLDQKTLKHLKKMNFSRVVHRRYTPRHTDGLF